MFSQFIDLIEPRLLLEQFGYIGLFAIVFAESGLFFGFFLPGDSLLLIAGVLAAAGYFNLSILIPVIFVAAFLGDQVGYWSGKTFGRRFFVRDKGWLWHKDRLTDAEAFFAKHGKKTIVLARFVPIIRTFTPIVAGIATMPYGTFAVYNFVGALLWGVGLVLAGFFVGSLPDMEKYLRYLIVAIIGASFMPVIIHALRRQK